MKVAERVVIVALLSLLVGVAVYFYFAIKSVGTEENVALIPEVVSQNEPAVTDGDEENWREWYPTVVPITIGSTTLGASVADSLPERIQGLSGTPYLPEGLVKLFAFGSAGPHDIWMKDMNYSLDIIWVDREGNITHIEEISVRTPTHSLFPRRHQLGT